ncbi:MAG: hypothetical protein Q9165_007982 [Trypethelium subeluteriae]
MASAKAAKSSSVFDRPPQPAKPIKSEEELTTPSKEGPRFDDGALAPNAGDPNEEEDQEADDEAISPSEVQEHLNKLAEGQRNAEKMETTTIPQDILDHWKEMNPIIHDLWNQQGLELTPEQTKAYNSIKEKIADTIKKNNWSLKQYQYPLKDIGAHIQLFGDQAFISKHGKTPEERKEAVIKLINEAQMYQQKVASWGLTWQDITPKEIQTNFRRMVQEHDAVVPSFIFGPTAGQENLVTKTSGLIEEIFRDTTNTDLIKKNTGEIQKVNLELENDNEENKYEKDMCVVPIMDLQDQLLRIAGEKDQEAYSKALNEIYISFRTSLSLLGLPIKRLVPSGKSSASQGNPLFVPTGPPAKPSTTTSPAARDDTKAQADSTTGGDTTSKTQSFTANPKFGTQYIPMDLSLGGSGKDTDLGKIVDV